MKILGKKSVCTKIWRVVGIIDCLLFYRKEIEVICVEKNNTNIITDVTNHPLPIRPSAVVGSPPVKLLVSFKLYKHYR